MDKVLLMRALIFRQQQFCLRSWPQQLIINNFASSFFQDKLLEKKEINKYLLDRGLSSNTIKNFNLGYSIDSQNDFYKKAKKNGYYDDYLKAKDIAIAKRKKMRDEMFAAKEAGDREKYEELKREITSTIRDWEMETEYGKAISQAYKEKNERGRELQFNTPITDEFLKHDGSDYYGDLADAAAKIGIKSSKVIDV